MALCSAALATPTVIRLLSASRATLMLSLPVDSILAYTVGSFMVAAFLRAASLLRFCEHPASTMAVKATIMNAFLISQECYLKERMGLRPSNPSPPFVMSVSQRPHCYMLALTVTVNVYSVTAPHTSVTVSLKSTSVSFTIETLSSVTRV